MKFQFYGDSWYWIWNYHAILKSDTVKSLYSTPYHFHPDRIVDAIPMLDILLKHLGHSSAHDCRPGQPFWETVDGIVNPESVKHRAEIKGETISADHHIVFYSSQLRGEELRDFLIANKNLNYKKFEEAYYAQTVKDLCLLGEHANNTNTKYLILPGQSVLYNRVFNLVPSHLRKNLVLLTECVLTHILSLGNGDKIEPYGPFFFTDVTGREIHVPWEELNSDITNNIHNQINAPIDSLRGITWPDSHHPGAQGTLVMLDMIFSHIEGK
jgi:hypothetical protein